MNAPQITLTEVIQCEENVLKVATEVLTMLDCRMSTPTQIDRTFLANLQNQLVKFTCGLSPLLRHHKCQLHQEQMHQQVPAPVATPPATNEGTKIVAIGNPGAGKSCFLNCLMGEVRFESGISYGGGLTKSASEVLQNGTTYIDTPGIADQMIEKVAARSVTHTLRKGGVFKLLFFVRLEAGRVIADDLVTIQRVLGSIRGDVMNQFAIVVNNVAPTAYNILQGKGPEFEQVSMLINSGKFITQHFEFVPAFQGLNEKDNAIISLPSTVTEFIANAPELHLERGQIGEIDTNDYRAEADRLRDQMEMVRRGKEAQRHQIEALKSARATQMYKADEERRQIPGRAPLRSYQPQGQATSYQALSSQIPQTQNRVSGSSTLSRTRSFPAW